MNNQTFQHAPINSIVVHKQVREEFNEEELRGLVQSVKEHGILQPLLVHRDQDALVLDDGERRLRAAKRAGLTTVPVLIEPKKLPAGEILERQLVANCQRQDLSAIEKARAIDRLMKETKSTAAETATRLGLFPSNVSKLLALLTLPASVQQKVESGAVSASTAYQIARTGDAETQEQLAAEVAAGGLTRDGVTRRRRATPAADASGPPKVRTRVVAVLGGGRSVTLSGSGLTSLDQLVTWLEELLAKARKARPRGVELPTFLSLLKDEAKAAGGGQP